MPLVGLGAERSAFAPTAFQSVGQASSASTSTGMTASASGSGRVKRAGAGVHRSPEGGQATRPQARRAGEPAAATTGGKSGHHVPHGNTALSVKADEARLAQITDEKERKRLKRLLRNRVSAQQARERKKAYLASLEQDEASKANRLNELENRVRSLERENQMLRQVIQTVTRKAVPANAADLHL